MANVISQTIRSNEELFANNPTMYLFDNVYWDEEIYDSDIEDYIQYNKHMKVVAYVFNDGSYITKEISLDDGDIDIECNYVNIIDSAISSATDWYKSFSISKEHVFNNIDINTLNLENTEFSNNEIMIF